MAKDTRYIHVLKYASYALLLVLLYVAQTTPRLLAVGGAKPLWVVPLALAVAMHEGEFAGGVFGAAAGLFCDLGGFSLFGFNGVVICAACVMAGLLIIYLMRCNVFGCMLFVFIAMTVRGGIGYLFAFGIWNYENAWKIFARQTFPTILYTTLAAVPVYFIVQAVHRRFQQALSGR